MHKSTALMMTTKGAVFFFQQARKQLSALLSQNLDSRRLCDLVLNTNSIDTWINANNVTTTVFGRAHFVCA